MTDQEIVNGLLQRDQLVIHWFFYKKCRPLFLSLMKKLFRYSVEYDEFVNDVAVFLFENDDYRLKQFDFQSSICLWMRTCLIRHFIRNGKYLIEDRSKEPLSPMGDTTIDIMSKINARVDMELLLTELAKKHKRQAYVLQRIIIEDADFDTVAKELNVTKANLYNIKKRAIEELTEIALENKESKR